MRFSLYFSNSNPISLLSFFFSSQREEKISVGYTQIKTGAYLGIEHNGEKNQKGFTKKKRYNGKIIET